MLSASVVLFLAVTIYGQANFEDYFELEDSLACNEPSPTFWNLNPGDPNDDYFNQPNDYSIIFYYEDSFNRSNNDPINQPNTFYNIWTFNRPNDDPINQPNNLNFYNIYHLWTEFLY